MGACKHLGSGDRSLSGRKEGRKGGSKEGRKEWAKSGRKKPFVDIKGNRAEDISVYAGNRARKRNDTKGRMINSRKVRNSNARVSLGKTGETGNRFHRTIGIYPIKEGAMEKVLVIPFELFGILMEVNHEQKQGKLEIMIGTTGQTESYATLNIMTKRIDGIVGKEAKEEVPQAMQSSGSVLVPNPTYGFPNEGSQLVREKIDRDPWNDWVGRDLEKLIYVERLGGGKQWPGIHV